ncbi:molybdopterin molybdotransferase MoeA [Virgisporangium aurantiacum]|uniref:Molybdopterin molybdenumtransferase n=1 Tax=Virgisporangium aurantiacum TaxID=175570 RepID=A0A8J3YZ74_9ACTN|nr:molybdopterin-binding protein [Virgisporangium aurantiacum]GIJ54451.1 molybdopterin molybdenumtransferase MoeA [Virgisporangium aurantiacum]
MTQARQPTTAAGGTYRAATGLSWWDAHEVAARAPRALGAERVASAAATGRTLADPVRAVAAAPAFDTAAMDGYAVAGESPWRVVGRVLAGGPAVPDTLSPGTAVEIGTGAVVPPGTRAVIPYERSHHVDDLVTGAIEDRRNIRTAGEDLRPGDEIVPAGRVVTASVLGAIAQAGVDEVTVRRRPRVRLLVTGDEVITGGRPALGQVRDAVSPIAAAVIERAGGDLVDHRHVGDDPDLLHRHVEAAGVDLVVVSGSSSIGAADHLRTVLAVLGARWYVDGVACRPGHPQALAETSDGRWLVGLPGNPFAALVAALTVLEPAVAALAGRAPNPPLRLPVTGDATPYPHGARLVPVHLGGSHARVVPGARPGSLRAAATADALAVLAPDRVDGEPAEILPLP